MPFIIDGMVVLRHVIDSFYCTDRCGDVCPYLAMDACCHCPHHRGNFRAFVCASKPYLLTYISTVRCLLSLHLTVLGGLMYMDPLCSILNPI